MEKSIPNSLDGHVEKKSTPSELRLGIAMSGGIALVLYQSGVAHELLRFSTDSGSEAYKNAISNTGIHPVLDIVTGASAGAINCVLLGHCLATGNTFKDFHDIWIEEADISKMRWPDSETKPISLLNSTPLIEKVKEKMRAQIPAQRPASAPTGSALLINCCRTDLTGFKISSPDALGHSMDDFTRSSVASFNADDFGVLGMVGEVVQAGVESSAFPAAFPPEKDKQTGHWYSDGGLWDNYPLNLAVEAIRDKPALGRTHRTVLLVQPEPVQVIEPKPASNPPNALEIASAVWDIGRGGSTWPAVKDITAMNEKIFIYRQFLHNYAKQLVSLGDIELNEATAQLKSYAGNPNLLNTLRSQEIFFDNDPALVTRYRSAFDNLRQIRCGDEKATMADKLAEVSLKALGLIDNFDLIRRAARREIDEINAQLEDGDSVPNAITLKASLYSQIERINDFLTIPAGTIIDLNDPLVATLHDSHRPISRFRFAGQRMLDTIESTSDCEQIKTAFALWFGAITEIVNEQRPENPTGEIPRNITAAYVSFIENTGTSASPTRTVLPWCQPTGEDAARQIIASLGGISAKKPVDLVRISPNDTNNLHLVGKSNADLLGTTAAKVKLAGEGLGHFSGFLEVDWRRNDYIWARLDAAELLLNILAKAAHSEGHPVSPATLAGWIVQAQQEILEEEAGWVTDAGLRDKIGADVKATEPGQPLTEEQLAANCLLIGRGDTAGTEFHVSPEDNASHLRHTFFKMLHGITEFSSFDFAISGVDLVLGGKLEHAIAETLKKA